MVTCFSFRYSLFTLPTRTRQKCLFLVSVDGVNTIGDKTKQESFVLTDPVSMSFVSFQFAAVQSQIYWGMGITENLEIEAGSRRDKTLLSCRQLCSHHRRGQDKSVPAVWTTY